MKICAVVVGFLEAVGRGMQLLVVSLRLEAERVEIGVEMAAHAVGADHHQRAHRVAGRPANLILGRGGLRPGFRRLGPELLGYRLFRRRPVAVERVDEIAFRGCRPIGLAPRRAARGLRHACRIVAEGREEVPPTRFNRKRVLLVFRLQGFDIGAVGAVQKRRLQQRLVDVLAGHATRTLFTCRSIGRPMSCRAAPARATRGCPPPPSPRSCPRRLLCRRR